jgi:hypothetical protein
LLQRLLQQKVSTQMLELHSPSRWQVAPFACLGLHVLSDAQ